MRDGLKSREGKKTKMEGGGGRFREGEGRQERGEKRTKEVNKGGCICEGAGGEAR